MYTLEQHVMGGHSFQTWRILFYFLLVHGEFVACKIGTSVGTTQFLKKISMEWKVLFE
jgi:hypothetical protein